MVSSRDAYEERFRYNPARIGRLLRRAGTLTAEYVGTGRSARTLYRFDGVLLARCKGHCREAHYDHVVRLLADVLRSPPHRHPSPLREANLLWMACVWRGPRKE